MGGIIFYIIIIVIIVNISKRSQKNNLTSQNQGAGTKISSAQPRTNSVPKTNTPSQTPVQSQKKAPANEPGSTTEMLRRKAQEDQVNHEKEKKYAEYKQKKTHKGKRYAQRYMLGDVVPNGMKIKYCGYCGAENLVSHRNREELLCYFCREEL